MLRAVLHWTAPLKFHNTILDLNNQQHSDHWIFPPLFKFQKHWSQIYVKDVLLQWRSRWWDWAGPSLASWIGPQHDPAIKLSFCLGLPGCSGSKLIIGLQTSQQRGDCDSVSDLLKVPPLVSRINLQKNGWSSLVSRIWALWVTQICDILAHSISYGIFGQ